MIDAHNSPLDFLNEHLTDFPKKGVFYVHCAGGYRSMIASSILKSRGIHNFIDISGGFAAIKEAEVPVTNYVCPSTIK
jgi:rhodanese-related sulfurtransferase